MSRDPSDDELRSSFAQLGFITCSPTIMPVLRRARKAADVSDVTVLLARNRNRQAGPRSSYPQTR